jgi:hypothetical protein
MNSFVNYMYGFHTVVSSAVDVVNNALTSFKSLNATINAVIPSTLEIADYKACLNNVFTHYYHHPIDYPSIACY